MSWHTGLRRLRLVGTLVLVVGVLACASVVATRTLGYAPNDSVASLFAALWPVGLVLVILGGLIWVGVWVLQGFVAPSGSPESESVPRRRPHLGE